MVSRICLLQTSGKIDGIEKGRETNKGNTRFYNITKLKKHFGIGCLINYKSESNNEIEEE